MTHTIHIARFDELDAATLHALLRLRSEVFIVEQLCAYPDIDGRDTEPDTLHLWIDGPRAYLRILATADGAAKIGRVVTSETHRGLGLASELIYAALDLIDPDRSVIIDAQSRLAAWYQGFGFVANGEEFLEDGIMHTPMRLDRRVIR